MSAIDPIGAAPETHSVRFMTLLTGASAAPLFWLGQVMLGYSVTAYACYPGDHPVLPSWASSLTDTMLMVDLVALAGCMAGAWISWHAWQRCGNAENRTRFLALWGMLSSLWFFFATGFNAIASLMVPPCFG